MTTFQSSVTLSKVMESCFKLGYRIKETESIRSSLGKALGLEQSLLVSFMKHQEQR